MRNSNLSPVWSSQILVLHITRAAATCVVYLAATRINVHLSYITAKNVWYNDTKVSLYKVSVNKQKEKVCWRNLSRRLSTIVRPPFLNISRKEHDRWQNKVNAHD